MMVSRLKIRGMITAALSVTKKSFQMKVFLFPKL